MTLLSFDGAMRRTVRGKLSSTWNPRTHCDSRHRVNGKAVVRSAAPLYNCQTGKRRGGFDEFFDFPPSHPDGTRSFIGQLQPTAARAVTHGDRVEISFDGFEMGIFKGTIRYTFSIPAAGLSNKALSPQRANRTPHISTTRGCVETQQFALSSGTLRGLELA